MRIIAGIWRGRSLPGPIGSAVRPTGDRVRQSLFDMLSARPGFAWEGLRVMDAFAGTGALAMEALSRGATSALLLEVQGRQVAALRAGIGAWPLPDGKSLRILQADARRPPPAEAPAGLLFLDPPYGQGLLAPALEALRAAGHVDSATLVVVETASAAPEALPGGLEVLVERRIGAALVRICAGAA